MGLSAFNRMRREKKQQALMEAERSRRDNELRNASRISKDQLHRELKEDNKAIREEEQAANQRIGEKVREGMGVDDEGNPLPGAERRVIDEPLRKDHAAEIAGRNLHDVDKPKDIVDRINERIPDGNTATQDMVEHTQVDREGPSKELVDAANEETGAGVRPGREEAAPAPAAPGSEESAAPQGETREPASGSPAPGDTRADEGEGDKAVIGDREESAQTETDAASEPEQVEIPENWRELDADARKKLASDISGEEVTTVREGDKIVREELARRAEADSEE